MLRQAINRLGTFNKCLAFVWPARFAARSQVRESRQFKLALKFLKFLKVYGMSHFYADPPSYYGLVSSVDN